MSFVCDFHVHLYPCYDLTAAFDAASTNLSRYGAAIRALCLTERSDCRFFQRLASADPSLQLGHWSVVSTPDPFCLRLESETAGQLYLFAGRQVATAERLELLALCTDADIPDGKCFLESQQQANEQGALCALNWALGKWMFARKKIVADIIAAANADTLAICDTSLRPTLWPQPMLMRRAAAKGCPLLVGSDPLPFPGEERLIGSYAMFSEETFAPETPCKSLRQIVDSSSSSKLVGRRSTVFQTFMRNIALLRSRPALLG